MGQVVNSKRNISKGHVALNFGNVGRSPLLEPAASRDYVISTVHDANQAVVKDLRDEFYGDSRARSMQRQWWLIDIVLDYRNAEPGVLKTHYAFNAVGPRAMNLKEVQNFCEAILLEIYKKVGRGFGHVRYQIMTPDMIEEWKSSGQLDPLPATEELNMREWTITFSGKEMHHNPPSQEEYDAFMKRRREP